MTTCVGFTRKNAMYIVADKMTNDGRFQVSCSDEKIYAVDNWAICIAGSVRVREIAYGMIDRLRNCAEPDLVLLEDACPAKYSRDLILDLVKGKVPQSISGWPGYFQRCLEEFWKQVQNLVKMTDTYGLNIADDPDIETEWLVVSKDHGTFTISRNGSISKTPFAVIGSGQNAVRGAITLLATKGISMPALASIDKDHAIEDYFLSLHEGINGDESILDQLNTLVQVAASIDLTTGYDTTHFYSSDKD